MALKNLFRRLWRPRWLIVLLVLLAAGGAALIAYYQRQFAAAQAAFDRDDFDVAKDHIDKCLALWPRSVAAHYLASRIDRFMGQFPSAQDHLLEVKRLEGTSEKLQVEMTMLRAHNQGIDEVEGSLANYVFHNGPESALVLKTLSAVFMRDSRVHRALAYLGQWVEKEPDRDTPYFWRGLVNYRLEQFADAIKDYLSALERNPENHIARRRLVEVFYRQNLNDQLGEHLDYLAEHDGDNIEVQIAMGRFRALQGEYDAARAILDGVLAREPNNGKALYQRGNLEMLAEQPDKAEPFLRRATDLKPTVPEALYAEFQCLSRLQRTAEAADFFKRFEAFRLDLKRLHALGYEWERSGRSPDVSAEIGEIYLRQGEVTRGVWWLYKGLMRDPLHQRTHQLLASHYEQIGDAANAAVHRAKLKPASAN